MQIVKGSFTLLAKDGPIEPISLQRNSIGFCHCGGELVSRAYFPWMGWAVAAACSDCHRLILLEYGTDWTWRKDTALEEVVDPGDVDTQHPVEVVPVSAVPMEQLQSVFTRAEIRDLLALQEGRPYVRQNVYRARAKFELFERLFRIRIKP
ncbi:MAG: hypothetical protein A4E45_01212 [Methanosaeta sp. PtaB.Bin039]|nr:MAG: hypothetical protein A4E45_01212 [Methanosaeta sp. PtaB.Bin039]